MRTVGLYTLGCKVSQYETEAIAERFSELGFLVVPFSERADAYVVNTCTVTAESDRKSRQIIRRAVKKNPAAVVAVVGCYSERSPNEILDIDGVDIVIGTDNKLSVAELVSQRLDNGKEKIFAVAPLSSAVFEKMSVKTAPRTRAYIKIEDGCESKCSYCAIRLARGSVRSKLPEDVILEAGELTKSGVPEIVLTGIETGAYGRDFDFDYTLGNLIMDIEACGAAKRIRLGSLAPELVGENFADKVRDSKILTPHFHISMQSGSDKVLAAMRRKYNSKMAYLNIKRLKEYFPTAEFTTDMMVGFPGESDVDFQDSLNFIEKAGFLDVHVFAYSKRAGTDAANYENQVSEIVKHERSRIMIEHKNAVRDSRLALMIDAKRAVSVVAETRLNDGTWISHADNFAEINFIPLNNENLQGEFVSVRPVSYKNGIILAEQI